MSNRYKGGVISATPPTTTGGESGTASGAWTLEQQAQLQAAGLWPAQPTGPYVEDVFSTYIYTGTGATQTITNGINLSGKGGLVWTKFRSGSFGTQSHGLYDTVRGVNKGLICNTTDAELTGASNTITAFNSNGYTMGADSTYGLVNYANQSYVSWTFREQAKFFDVVTWTGNGVGGRQIAHNLGSVPGCLMVKVLSEAGGWSVWHRAIPGDTNQTGYLSLNSTQEAELNKTNVWAPNGITSTYFTASIDSPSNINGSGQTYVAYLFAHNAGGFGLTGTDNVISCGSFTTDGSGNATVNLGYEPQWLLIKSSSNVDNWKIGDNMRGWTTSEFRTLLPNLSNAEGSSSNPLITSTGFQMVGDNASRTFIYIAIRRGPMRTPTVGTTVFSTNAVTVSAGTQINTGFPVDLAIAQQPSYANSYFEDRLRGVLTSTATSPEIWLQSWNNYAEGSGALGYIRGWNSIGFLQGNGYANVPELYWSFRRAPSFFDEVCYTGTGSATTQTHNLGVAPELIICKRRNGARNWPVRYSTAASPGYGMYLDDTGGEQNIVAAWTTTAPTATVFSIGASTDTNGSGDTYVAYLFATCPGVSKVGSFSGTGATQTINCGFTTGARFVLIKRTDSTGDWYVWNSASGMVAGTNPYLLLNSTAAQVNANNVYTTAVGFQIVGTGAGINASGGTYIFLAIA